MAVTMLPCLIVTGTCVLPLAIRVVVRTPLICKCPVASSNYLTRFSSTAMQQRGLTNNRFLLCYGLMMSRNSCAVLIQEQLPNGPHSNKKSPVYAQYKRGVARLAWRSYYNCDVQHTYGHAVNIPDVHSLARFLCT